MWFNNGKSARRRKYAALEKHNQAYSALCEGWMWEVDLNDVYLHVSDEVQQTLGFAPQELLGGVRHPGLFVAPEPCIAAAITARQEYKQCQIEMTHKDGRKLLVESSAVPLFDKSGQLQGYCGLDRDITIRRQSEQRLIKSEESSKLSALAKDTFVNTLGHEIRTPMNGVAGLMELLLDSPLREDQREYATAALSCATSLLNLVDDLHDYSKLNSSGPELNLQAVDLRRCVEGAVLTLAVKAQEKGLKLPLIIAHDVPTMVSADPSRLSQVIINLLNNSIKFTNQGSVRVEVRSVALAGNAKGVQFQVSDTGIGIPSEQLPQLFEAFVPSNKSTSRVYGGAGLGLFVCRELISAMGGEIRVESQDGKGSSFVFELPLEVLQQESDTPLVQELSKHTKTVLVADRNALYRRAIKQQLVRLHWQIIEVSDGPALLQALRSDTVIDCIVVDNLIPSVRGDEVLSAAKNSQGGRRPVIVTTMILSNQNGPGILNIGADGYLNKPVQEQILHRLLQQLVLSPKPRPARVSANLLPTKATLNRPQLEARVLLVEDNPIDQKIVRKMLGRLGCTCEIATNAQQALVAMQDKYYDLMLFDYDLPEIGGVELAREMRKRKITAPIIAITAMDGDNIQQRCLSAGMNDFMRKPVSFDSFCQLVSKWLRQPSQEQGEA